VPGPAPFRYFGAQSGRGRFATKYRVDALDNRRHRTLVAVVEDVLTSLTERCYVELEVCHE
jgi:hypothetical protein